MKLMIIDFQVINILYNDKTYYKVICPYHRNTELGLNNDPLIFNKKQDAIKVANLLNEIFN